MKPTPRVPDLGRHRARRATRRLCALMGMASLGGAALPLSAAAARPATVRTVSARQVADALEAHPLRGLDGRPLSLRTSEGQVVVLNFWASWCAPCRRELPVLDALHASLKGHGARIVAVSVDAEAANARRFQQKLGLSLPIAHDGPDGLARRLDLPSLPYTVVLGRDGRVAWSTQSSDARALAALEAETRRLLAEPHAAAAAEAGRP